MKIFSKEESLAVVAILLALIIISVPNFQVSLRRARDAQRKNDIGILANSLGLFANNFGSFPLSTSNGEIMACNPRFSQVGKQVKVDFDPCEWGKNALKDPFGKILPPYIANLPFEPKAEDGLNYFYISNGKYFQIYAHLEGKDEAENDPKIARRNIPCGSAICNFGRSSGDTPLDKSLEEYENELLEELKGKGVNIQK